MQFSDKILEKKVIQNLQTGHKFTPIAFKEHTDDKRNDIYTRTTLALDQKILTFELEIDTK